MPQRRHRVPDRIIAGVGAKVGIDFEHGVSRVQSHVLAQTQHLPRQVEHMKFTNRGYCDSQRGRLPAKSLWLCVASIITDTNRY